MTEDKKQKNLLENKGMTKFVLKTVSITLLTIVISFFYVLSTLIVFAPSTAGKVFNVIGSEKAVTICCEREYRKNSSNINLYKLIQQSINTDDYERVESYVYAITHSSNYKKFEDEINSLSRKNVPNNKIAYVYDVDSYLTGAYVEALYNQGKKAQARQEFQFSDLNRNGYPYSVSMITYINCLYIDNSITDEEKSSEFAEYFNNSSINGNTIKQHLEYRLDLIESIDESTLAGKIFNVYMQIKMTTCFYKIYDIIGNTAEKQYYSDRVAELTSEYNNLINS